MGSEVLVHRDKTRPVHFDGVVVEVSEICKQLLFLQRGDEEEGLPAQRMLVY